MRAGPGPGGRPQRDVRKPLARHAAHGSDEPVDPPEGVLGGASGPARPATFAPHDGRAPSGYDPGAGQYADQYDGQYDGQYAQQYPGPYDPYAGQHEPDVAVPPVAVPSIGLPPAGLAPGLPSQAPAAAHLRPDVPPVQPALPPVVPVPPGPLTTALPTSLNYAPAPVAEPPRPVVPQRPAPAGAPAPYEPAAPAAYQPPEAYPPDTYQPPVPATYPPEDDGHRLRSPAADTGSTVLPTRRARRDAGSHRTGPAAPGTAPSSALGAVAEVAVVVVLALVLAVVVKSFLVQAFSIPSGSMEDTLLVGDRVLVNKLTPKVFDLHRGDVVVFRDSGHWLDPTVPAPENPVKHAVRVSLTFIGLLPDEADEHLIKRVIGLPGDTVACCDAQGRVTVNGVPLDEPYLRPGVEPSDKRFRVVVPAGRLWVMGDNRSFSADSRSHMNLPGGGTVPESDVVGKAFAVVWPFGRFGGLGVPDSVFAGVPPASRGS